MLVSSLKIFSEPNAIPGTDWDLYNSRMNRQLNLMKVNSFFRNDILGL